MDDIVNSISGIIPPKYQFLIGASLIIGRIFQAIRNGGGLKSIIASVWLGTNTPKVKPPDGNSSIAGPLVLVVLFMLAFTAPAVAQTDSGPVAEVVTVLPPSTIKTIATDGLAWFKDQTNFWGQKTILVGVNALYSKGHLDGSGQANKNTWGAVMSLAYPLDDKGQITLGFFGAYFNGDVFDGSIATTLGKTINIPYVNQQVFLFAEAGPAVNLNNPDRLLAQGFVGAVWKRPIGKGFTLYVDAGYGKVTDWSGNVLTGGVKIGKAF